MSPLDVISSLLIAAAAMYGLGLPLAWLFPAPSESQWVYRIAVSPLYAIVLTTTAAWILGVAGVPLHPVQFAAVVIASWAFALWRRRQQWGRPSVDGLLLPAAMVGASGVIWFFSLAGYGLYLPNRDFKNHAYWVAQVSFWQTSDPSRVLSSSPTSGLEEGLFYPLGLHTMLGWALPTSTWSSVGVTAAAAVLTTSVSLPLALVALARLWDPESRILWVLAGASAVALPGFTRGFDIGSVVILMGTALYAAALAVMWTALRDPVAPNVLALGLVGLGLFHLHIAEALGLALVGLAAVLVSRPWQRVEASWALFWAVAVPVGLGIGYVLTALPELSGRATADWDIQPNDVSPVLAWAIPLVVQPASPGALGLLWLCLVLLGVFVLVVGRRDSYLVVALAVPLVLSHLAAARGVPNALSALTAPWYGTPSRIAILAAAPLALFGCIGVTRLMGMPGRWRARLAAAVSLALVAAMSASLVPSRRADLKASLAGAGDTPTLASQLAGVLAPGETVMNLEGDGTENLFAFARVPVIEAFRNDPAAGGSAELLADPVQARLLQLDDPEVARRLRELRVGYIAIGTTTPYWGDGPGYNWQMVASQDQATPAFQGTDMTILKYEDLP